MTTTEYAVRRTADGAVSTTTADRAKAVAHVHAYRARGLDVALVARTVPDGAWTAEPVPARLVFAPTSRYLIRGRH